MSSGHGGKSSTFARAIFHRCALLRFMSICRNVFVVLERLSKSSGCRFPRICAMSVWSAWLVLARSKGLP